MAGIRQEVCFEGCPEAYLIKWKVKPGSRVSQGTVLLLYDVNKPNENKGNPSNFKKLKATMVGSVVNLLKKEGDKINIGCPVLYIEGCAHPIVMKDMCAECGADLRESHQEQKRPLASVAMVHSVPELVVSDEQAQILGKADETRLLTNRKLVLLVDLDQTLIHTTNDDVPPKLKDVYHFQLHGYRSQWYHARIRPGTRAFLEKVSAFYELHICTFGARQYAHTVTRFLDEDGRYFSHRILSRDECFNSNSKTANLRALFPCGDKLVCIIDDREDVWNFAPNLVHVKPYHFFQHTGDINAPQGLGKYERDAVASSKEKIRTARKHKKRHAPKLNIVDLKHEHGKNREPRNVDDVKAKSESNIPGKNFVENPKRPLSCETAEEHVGKILNEIVQKVAKEIANSIDEAISEGNVDDSCQQNGKEENEAEQNSKEKNNDVKDSDTVPGMSDIKCVGKDDKHDEDLSNTEKNGADMCAMSEGVQQSIGQTQNETSKDAKIAETCRDIAETKSMQPETTDEMSDDSEMGTQSSDDLLAVEDGDDYLMYLSDILITVHKAFYEMYDKLKQEADGSESYEIPDLKRVIPYVRKKILKGAKLVFSGVIPTNMPLEKSRVYHVAKSLGAEIQAQLVPRKKDNKHLATTHVVAARLGTVKVNEAKRCRGIHIVTPEWLWCCAERWERVNERLFPLTKETPFDSKVNFSEPVKDHNSRPNADIVSNQTVPAIVDVFPTYDPVTGKRINKAGASSSTMPKSAAEQGSSLTQKGSSEPGTVGSKEQDGNFASSFNPLLSFSSEDIKKMDQEVEDILDSLDSEEESEGEITRKLVLGKKRKSDELADESSSSSSSDESLGYEPHPHGWKRDTKKRRFEVEDPDDHSSIDSNTNDYDQFDYPRGKLGQESDGSVYEKSSGDDFDTSVGSVDEDMAAAVEREFLGL